MNRIKLLGFTCLYVIKQIPTYISLLNEFDQVKFDQMINDYAKGVVKALGIDYEIINKLESKPQAALYISNHSSMYDSVLTLLVVEENRSYFIASEFENMLKVPVIGNLLRFMHAIYVDRSNLRSSLKTIKKGINELKNQKNLVIFAEGEITNMIIKPNQKYVGDFHGGSFKPAIEAKVPIVPITIIGSEKIHSGQKMYTKIKPGHVKIVVGEAITKHLEQRMSKVELADYTRNVIVNNYIENNEE